MDLYVVYDVSLLRLILLLLWYCHNIAATLIIMGHLQHWVLFQPDPLLTQFKADLRIFGLRHLIELLDECFTQSVFICSDERLFSLLPQMLCSQKGQRHLVALLLDLEQCLHVGFADLLGHLFALWPRLLAEGLLKAQCDLYLVLRDNRVLLLINLLYSTSFWTHSTFSSTSFRLLDALIDNIWCHILLSWLVQGLQGFIH